MVLQGFCKPPLSALKYSISNAYPSTYHTVLTDVRSNSVYHPLRPRLLVLVCLQTFKQPLHHLISKNLLQQVRLPQTRLCANPCLQSNDSSNDVFLVESFTVRTPRLDSDRNA